MRRIQAFIRGFLMASGLLLGCLCVGSLFGGCLSASAVGHDEGAVTSSGGTGGTTGTDSPLSSLVVEPSVLDFGDTPVGTTVTRSVTLVNVSNAPVIGITVAMGGPDASLFKVGDLPTSLAANSQAAVNISYSPMTLETRSTAAVTFLASGGGRTIDLYGEPVGVAWTVAPNPINFSYVPPTGTVVGCTTVTNGSTLDLEITSVASFDTCGGAFALATTDDAMPPNPFELPITIAGGESAKVCFSFTPPIIGECQGQATLITNDPSGFNPVIQFAGWGGGPQINCTPLTLAFGETPDHSIATIPVICENLGTAIPGVNLTIDPPTASPTVFTAEFDESKDPYPLGGLAPGQSVQIDVNYAPVVASNDKGTVTIKTNVGPSFEIPLTGQGLDVPPCQFVVSPLALDFGNVPVDGPASVLSFEIENVGANTCLIQNPSITGDPAGAFSIASTSIPPDSIGKITIPAAGAGVDSSLIIDVAFAPTAIGAVSAEFSIAGQTLVFTGTCEATCLTVSPSTIDFGHVGVDDAGAIVSSAPRTFEVSTQCPGKTSLESITLQSGPGDSEAQFSLVPAPALPAVISQGSSLSFQVSCTPTMLGDHVAQLLVSDGTLDTLLPLSCSAP